MKVFTVGYEDCEIGKFAQYLESKRINLVLDIRKNPISRKKGFSKNKLAENLRTKGIEYMHCAGLGVPKAWRDQNKKGELDRLKMFKDYVKEILPQEENKIREVLSLVAKQNVALLCFEADAHDCHRHYLAEELKRQKKGKIKIVNLDARLPVARAARFLK